MRVVVLAVVLAGCGRLSFDELVAGDGSAQKMDAALTTYRDVVMQDSPAAYWRFAAAAPAHDELGNADLTFMGTCPTTTGALTGDTDTAMQFDGTTCYATTSSAPDAPNKSPFSAEMWVRDSLTTTYQIYYMNETRIGNGPMDGYAVLINDTTGVYLERIVNQNGQVTNPVAITPNQWTHIVATYDGANVAMFIDGVQVGPAKTAPEIMPAVSVPASIGSIYDGFTKLHGDLDEVAIYDHALSPERIAKHHSIGVDGPSVGN